MGLEGEGSGGKGGGKWGKGGGKWGLGTPCPPPHLTPRDILTCNNRLRENNFPRFPFSKPKVLFLTGRLLLLPTRSDTGFQLKRNIFHRFR